MNLVLNNVTKRFKEKEAIKNINLNFIAGIYGLLGSNGAGKTTMIRCVCDLYELSEGEISYDGTNIKILNERYRDKIGYLPQDFGYYPDYTALKFLMYIAAMKGMKLKTAKQKSESLLAEVGLHEVRNKKLKSFSGGMLKRIGIAQALLNDPRILILDEPTAGLDPKERIRFKNILSRYSENHIVLISTHIVSDIEYIAKEIILLKNGEVVNIGNRNTLLDEISGMVWEGEISVNDMDRIYTRYKISSIKNEGTINLVRLISEIAPCDNFIQVNPTLDDLYLYYFEEVSVDAAII